MVLKEGYDIHTYIYRATSHPRGFWTFGYVYIDSCSAAGWGEKIKQLGGSLSCFAYSYTLFRRYWGPCWRVTICEATSDIHPYIWTPPNFKTYVLLSDVHGYPTENLIQEPGETDAVWHLQRALGHKVCWIWDTPTESGFTGDSVGGGR